MNRWYESSFGERYLQLYRHRSHEEADRALEALLVAHPPGAGPVLDLACGAGRHLAALERRGVGAVGLDLSAVLLREARGRARSPLVRADMRQLPFGPDVFSLLLCMFTSFGYFGEPAAHAPVVAGMDRVCSGPVVLDLPNPPVLRRALVARSEREVDGLRVVERRWLEDAPARVCKDIELLDPSGGQVLERYEERVTLFGPGELDDLFRGCDRRPVARYGDYDGRSFDEATSPRHIAVYERGRA